MTEAGDKPAILKESQFTVTEGVLYRALRTGSIWMNKLFFSSIFLLVVWVIVAASQGDTACAGGVGPGNGTEDVAAIEEGVCSPLLTPTAKYLGAMTLFSFLLSIVLGALGLVVGKQIIESTPADEEAGAPPADDGGDGEQS